MLCDERHRCEWRPQDERRRRLFDGEPYRHATAERFAEVDQSRWIDVSTADRVRASRPCVVGQPVLGRRTRIATVAAVVGQQHVESMTSERGGKRRSIAAMATVT